MKVFVENRDRQVYGGRRAALEIGPHYHSHYEVIYVKQGHSLMSIDGCVYPIRSGDLVIALPYQVHHIQDLAPCESYLFIVPDNICEEFRTVFSQSTPISPVLHGVDQQKELSRLLTVAIDTLESPQPFAGEIVKGFLIVILGLAFRQMEFIPKRKESTDIFRQIVKHCTENFDQPLSLERLSVLFYLSRYQISRLFSQNIGMSFPKFLSGIRVMEACRLLRDGASITETALGSGFATIRSFNRCFLEQTGITPKKYKQLQLKTDHTNLQCQFESKAGSAESTGIPLA